MAVKVVVGNEKKKIFKNTIMTTPEFENIEKEDSSSGKYILIFLSFVLLGLLLFFFNIPQVFFGNNNDQINQNTVSEYGVTEENFVPSVPSVPFIQPENQEFFTQGDIEMTEDNELFTQIDITSDENRVLNSLATDDLGLLKNRNTAIVNKNYSLACAYDKRCNENIDSAVIRYSQKFESSKDGYIFDEWIPAEDNISKNIICGKEIYTAKNDANPLPITAIYHYVIEEKENGEGQEITGQFCEKITKGEKNITENLRNGAGNPVCGESVTNLYCS